MESVKLRLGLQTVMLISNRGNIYLQSSGLNKALLEQDPKRCAQVVSRAVNLIYLLSALVYPFMPAISDSMLVQLNAPARVVSEVLCNDVLPGHTIGKPEHLFKKIDEKMVEVWRAQFSGGTSAEKPAAESAGKRTTASAKSNANANSKSPQYLALEQKIAEQGQVVRNLKAQNPKTKELEEQIASEIVELKRLKEELASVQVI
jgi:methionyl-tRNA synthetase